VGRRDKRWGVFWHQVTGPGRRAGLAVPRAKISAHARIDVLGVSFIRDVIGVFGLGHAQWGAD